MANPTMFDVYMGIGKAIQAINPQIPLILKGMDMPSLEIPDQFLQFDFLGNIPMVCRVDQIRSRFPFQLTCYSKSAFIKKESGPTSFASHVQMADTYSAFLHQQDFVIKNSCIRLEECRISFLDLRTSTFTAKGISTGTTPLLNCQSAVILVDGRLITNKE